LIDCFAEHGYQSNIYHIANYTWKITFSIKTTINQTFFRFVLLPKKIVISWRKELRLLSHTSVLIKSITAPIFLGE